MKSMWNSCRCGGLAACEVRESFLHNKDIGTDKGKENLIWKEWALTKEKEKVHAFHMLLEYINGFGIN
jgi:hypothetical protein